MILCKILRIAIGGIKLFLSFRRNKKVETVLIFASFFPGNAGYYYRSQKWATELNNRGIKTDVFHVFDSKKHTELTAADSLVSFHILNIFYRFIQVLKSARYDRVIVRRSLLQYNDYGNLFLDKLLLCLHPRAILDFDDDITNNFKGKSEKSLFGKLLVEDRFIFYKSLKLYKRFLPGSEYLKILLKNTNKKVNENDILVLPTCVDYKDDPSKNYPSETSDFTLGWIGSNGNQEQLDKLVPVLNELIQKVSFELLVISGKPYQPKNALFPIKFAQWSLESEKQDLYRIDIGIMPLENDKMSRAKCGFKLIQYMGLGIVSVASAVTTNNRIIDNNENGFLVNNPEDWHDKLLEVIGQRSRFSEISNRARIKIEKHYSFEAHLENLEAFIKA